MSHPPSVPAPRPNSDRSAPTNILTKLSKVRSPLEIPTTDIIKIIEQYLQEQGLNRTLHALQEESQVTTNSVNNVEVFLRNVENGNWDGVLEELATFRIPFNKLLPLYDQIVLELCELEEFDLASTLLQQTPLFQKVKIDNKERWEKLQRFVGMRITEPNQLYESTPKKSRRQNIAKLLSGEISVAPKGRLLSIITNSLRYQQAVGSLPQHLVDYSIFNDNLSMQSVETQKPVTDLTKQISCHIDGSIDLIQSMLFSYNGKYLLTGNDKGVIEVWDLDSGKPTTDLEYQRNYEYMMHFDPISVLSLSKDNEVLASGSRNGDIKIWAFYSGECLIDLKQAHAGANITHLEFSSNGLTLLSAADDNTVKIWDLTNQINTFTYYIDNNVTFLAYSSMAVNYGAAGDGDKGKFANFQNSAQNYILILDTQGIFYLYNDHDLIIKKQLMSNVMLVQGSANALLQAAASKQEGNNNDTSNNGNNDNGLDMSTLLGANNKANTTISSKQQQSTPLSLYNAFMIPIRPDVVVLCTKNDHSIHLMNDKTGELLSSLHNLSTYHQTLKNNLAATPEELQTAALLAKSDVTHVCLSGMGKFVYALTTSNLVVVFNFENGKIEKVLNPHDGALVMGLCHHPYRNLLVTFGADGLLKIWK